MATPHFFIMGLCATVIHVPRGHCGHTLCDPMLVHAWQIVRARLDALQASLPDVDARKLCSKVQSRKRSTCLIEAFLPRPGTHVSSARA